MEIPDGVKGAISGDDSASDGNRYNAAIITATGAVRYYGTHVGATQDVPGTLQYDGIDITGMVHVDTWTDVSPDANKTGGVVAGTTGADVYQWFRNGTGTGTPATFKVEGITGNVISIESNDGYSYVLTTDGLFFWPNAEEADGSMTVTATYLEGTQGATQLSTWSTRETGSLAFGGGIVLADGSVAAWEGNHTLTTQAVVSSGIRTLFVSQAGLYVLTDAGTLYTAGPAFSTSPGGSAWTQRASGVSSFSAWGVTQGSTHYTGGAYVTATGEVVAFSAVNQAGRAWTTVTKTYPAGVSTSQVFASDGFYLSLATNGDVYAWAGNALAGDLPPELTNSDLPASDLEVWGFHRTGANLFYGGGYIISSPDGC